MKIEQEVFKQVKEVVGICCDQCGITYSDQMEIQEFLSYKDTGGYSSKIGDGVMWELDLCQNCVISTLSPYIRRVGNV